MAQSKLQQIKTEVDAFLNETGLPALELLSSSSEVLKWRQKALSLEKELERKTFNVTPNKKRRMDVDELNTVTDAKDREITRVKAVYERQIEQMEMEKADLNRTLRFVSAEEQELRSKLEAIEKKHDGEMQQVRSDMDKYKMNAMEFENQAVEWRERYNDTLSLQHNESDIHKIQLHRHDAELEKIKKSFESKIKLIEKKHASQFQVLEAELQLEKINCEDAKQALQGAKELVQQAHDIKELRNSHAVLQARQRQYLREIEKLKKAAQDATIVNEKMDHLKAQLAASERQCSELLKISVENEYDASQNEQWSTVLATLNDSPVNEIVQLAKKQPVRASLLIIKDLQAKQRRLVEEKGALQIAVKRQEVKIGDLSRKEQASSAKCAELETSLLELSENSDTQLEMANRNSTILTQKYDDLSALYKTYESNVPEATRTRIEQLESTLAQSNRRVFELEQRIGLTQSPMVAKKNKTRIEELELELKQSKQECIRITHALEKTERELSSLESQVGKGGFDPAKTKVLHLPSQHVSGSVDEVKRLRSENESLKKQLAARTESSLFATPQEECHRGGGNTPHETLAGQKLLNKRLKEVFREQITRYREAVYLLTGYSIELRAEYSLLRLRSVYAERQEDELLFEMSDDTLVLKETPFCQRLDRKIFAYLNTCHSIPAFLSTLTLHLFEQQTFQG